MTSAQDALYEIMVWARGNNRTIECAARKALGAYRKYAIVALRSQFMKTARFYAKQARSERFAYAGNKEDARERLRFEARGLLAVRAILAMRLREARY